MSEYRIQFHCPTEYKDEVWPKFFNESLLPRIGEMVKSRNGVALFVINVLHSEEAPDKYTIPLRHLVEIILDYSRRT